MTQTTQFHQTFESEPVFNAAVVQASHLVEKVDPCGELHVIVDDYNVEDDHMASARGRWDALSQEERAAIEALEPLSVPERETAVVLGSGCLWMFEPVEGWQN